MKVKLIIISIILLLVIVFATGCIPVLEKLGLVNPTNEEQLSSEKGGPPDGLVKVLIGFKEKPGAAQQAMVQGVGGKIKYTYHIVDAIAASIPQKAIDALRKNPNVRYVEPDGQVYALDAELDNSWGVKHIGAGDVHNSIDPPSNKGAEVRVAIIDSGIDYNHQDLDNNYISGVDIGDGDVDPMDDSAIAGHGTHVAGIVAAEDNNIDDSVVGVAPEAHLYAVKVFNTAGKAYESDVIAGIAWSMGNWLDLNGNEEIDTESFGSEKGVMVDVINMSIGSSSSSESLMIACDAAYAAGIVLVAAAGNSGNPPGRGDNIIYPARYGSVIAVAATDQNDKRARWSSTGPDLELAAPGVSIYSTYIGGGYATMSGTSMASPHVAGVAALVIAAGISDVRAQLQSTADDLGDSSLYGNGLVNATEAVGVTSGAPEPPPAGGTIHVDSIDFSAKKAGKNLFLYTTVEVLLGDNGAVDGARVTMTLTGGTSSWNFSSDTGLDGTVKFTLKAQPGNYSAEVTYVSHTEYDWDGVVMTKNCQLDENGNITQ